MADSLFIESPDVMAGFTPFGSACCVWTDALSTYVVTAAHVLSAVGPETRMRWISADLSSSGGGAPLTSLLWLSIASGELDAGLIEIDDLGPFRAGGPYPRGSQVLAWDAIQDERVVQICGKHGVQTARVTEKLAPGKFFKGHIHGRLLQSTLIGGQTRPGDSGAAVISQPDGMLVGMHIALETDAQGRRHSFAVAAEDIQNAFSALKPGFGLRP